MLEKAMQRLASIRSIDPDFDLGNGLTLKKYQETIELVKAALELYNMLLSTLDEKRNSFFEVEDILKDLNERMLIAVLAKYGKDSSEYEQAGGVRKSERKKYTYKKKNRESLPA